MNEKDLILGIDLGTTNSLIALSDSKNGPRVLHRPNESPLVPSVVRLSNDPNTAPVVGKTARDTAVQFPTNTISSIKRFMGRDMKDVQPELSHVGFTVVEGANETARVQVGGDRVYSPQEISAMILGELKSIAEDVLHTEVRKAVITVPAYFDDAQRQATRDAGRFAGLDVVRVINEPTAAALAYGIGTRKLAQPETIAVYDLGGGTFDISILQIIPPDEDSESASEGVDETQAYFQVLSTAGDTHLGGDDVDMMIIDLVKREIAEQFNTRLELPASTRQALRLFAESAKIRLSSDEQANLQIDIGSDRRYTRTITRAEFEQMIAPWIERTLASCRRALTDAKRTPADIDRVVMVGGSTRIPLVRKMVGEFFDAVPYTALDPDQVVALGAAVQAAMLSGQSSSALLLDVIPLSLGIETMGGAVAKLIMRNSTVPCSAAEKFSTSVDGQTNIKIHVLQGERELVDDCRSLGQFDLRGIPPMPAGIPQLEVTFHVDVNGVLDVSAIEKRSGKRAAVQILPSHGLTREEVDAIEQASYEHARDDMTLHRIIDLRVNSALDIKWINEGLVRVKAQLDPIYLKDLYSAIARLQSFIDNSEKNPREVDPDDFHKAKENLDRMSMRLHEVAIAQSLKNEPNP